ncbi:MAG: FAD-binding protein [Xanthobacteraceae bacterium]|nr:FAD-binding protein [Xanthobacteraceae bacterium]
MRSPIARKFRSPKSVSQSLTRRSFLRRAAAASLLPGALSIRAARAEKSTRKALGDLPGLDGHVLMDEADRRLVAADYGGHVSRLPIAVLRPGSARDVVRMVDYANKHGLRIAMRGGGHSQYGQSQVADGIVVDSSTLNSISWHGDTIDAQPGAQWGDVAKAALSRGLIPPVMVDAMVLTVGGTLSVGGTGETGYRHGAQVDNVVELDVVTGAGELLTCSLERNRELFEMTLAGLGQCGIIVRARLRLVPAGGFVVPRTLTYDNVDDFISDQARLTQAEKLGLLNGAAIRTADGRSRFEIYAASLVDSAADADHPPVWLNGLRFASERAAAPMPYWNYLDRRRASVTASLAAVKRGVRNAALVATLPHNSAKEILAHILSTPETYVGIWTVEVSAKVPARYTRPLLRMPDADIACELRVQRRSSGTGSPDPETLLAATNALLPRVLAAGGKISPPYCPILSKQQWRDHYGPELLQRFAAAKKKFDPNSALTPGPGIFS